MKASFAPAARGKTRARRDRPLFGALLAAAIVVGDPASADAYIGPGAGFAVASSAFAVFAALLAAIARLAFLPFRMIRRAVRGRGARRRRKTRRVVIVGLDGLDPELAEGFLARGLMPNFERLRASGGYRRLATSFPAESPVAWSCFQTGVNPGRHRVFDFLVPNRKSYLPELSTAKVTPPRRRIRIGRYRVPLSKPTIDLGRKSRSFWSILGDHGIFSTVVRVPITFPPERFHGALLSAMCVPDLKGTQGSFTYFTSDPAEATPLTGGVRVPVSVENGRVETTIPGPSNDVLDGAPEMTLPLEIRVDGDGAVVRIDGHEHRLEPETFSPWIELVFRPMPGVRVHGITRFYLRSTSPELRLYMSPINVDPDRPALPISHPAAYSGYLSRSIGRFATLGLAEDTWGLNERVLDEKAFLDQAWSVHEEREKMFFDALDKTRDGCVVCVFDITDRLAHMFYRYLDAGHPANAGQDTTVHRDAIQDLYVRMDGLVGRAMAAVGEDETLIVLSDHGMKPFRRGVNLNTWLRENGYLALRGEAPTDAPWYEEVDWSRTQAFACGLGGIYLNVRGEFAQGIVEPGEEATSLRRQIRERLEGLRDPASGGVAVARVYDLREDYDGPYTGEGPDLLAGCAVGYRVSWSCAMGAVAPEVFEDNVKAWSGDHCMNPPDVPGVFFCNRPIDADDIRIHDVGPTVLDLLGAPVPGYSDGVPIALGTRES